MTWSLPWRLFACLAAQPPTPQPPPEIPSLAAAELGAGAQPLMLAAHLPGYDLRVLDQRKPVSVETAAGKVEVRLPIYVYVPAPERQAALRQLREASDELRRAAHSPDRAGVDLDGLLARFEHALAALGAP